MATSSSTSITTPVVTPVTPPDENDGAPAKEKRRRAGKPKVRTGCVTCKIRRIKCDEGKPACQRCISTGRKCDGYKPTTRPKATRKPGFVQQLTTSTPTSLTLLRPLVTNFASDDMERHYIHRFLPIAEDVVGIQHIHNGFFWGHVIPEYCFMFDCVKHACVALSSAYHNFQVVGYRPDTSSPPTRSERYVLKEYNLALNKMAEEINSVPLARRYGIIMICCVFFFYIEIMRNQWPTALMHLVNGLRLMTCLPAEVEDIYKNPEKWSQGHDTTHARAIYMLKLLTRWEVSAGFMAANLQPFLSNRAYESRKRVCAAPAAFHSLDHLREVIDDFYQDVNAFIWQCKQHKSNSKAWDHSATQCQYDVLQQRSYLLSKLVEKAQESYGDLEHTAKASEYLTFQGCLLHHRGASLALDFAPLPRSMRHSPLTEDLGRFEEIMTIATTIKLALQTALGPGSSPWFNVDFGVVSNLYISALSCPDAAMAARLFKMIKEWPWRENLWDGPLLRQQLQKEEVKIEEVELPAVTSLAYRPVSRQGG